MTQLIESINLGIYPGYVLFSNGFNYDELMGELHKFEDGDWFRGISEETDRALIESGNYFALKRKVDDWEVDDETKEQKMIASRTLYYIIISEEFKFTDFEYAKLAHECLHICQFHLPDLLDRNREWESEAYLHTHLMLQCLTAMRNNTLK